MPSSLRVCEANSGEVSGSVSAMPSSLRVRRGRTRGSVLCRVGLCRVPCEVWGNAVGVPLARLGGVLGVSVGSAQPHLCDSQMRPCGLMVRRALVRPPWSTGEVDMDRHHGSPFCVAFPHEEWLPCAHLIRITALASLTCAACSALASSIQRD